ncbi:FAD-dependent oxidoreductase [Nocardia sp. NBC_00565]|uniref:FAD-dependent oxidoreductase n=1 Tax=Nocardia sp. NBC_00565 TaxID=2975993 RepID=UPI002E805957|nr:FAD-dependent oxidoreductase [Nocardia sp. NBC_00565]WUC03500.1 FAD-dependent oxidoreductase [Nocardia sp. NBC_00565]
MDAELAVIGLGSIGSMALWQAARQSTSVVGFEAQTTGHSRSAVGGDTRLFRMTYRDGVNYSPLLIESSRLWETLEAESGLAILNRCGGLSIGAREGNYIPKVLATARANGTEHILLDHDELAARYPQHGLRPDNCAIFDPNAGYLRTDLAVLAAREVARDHGAQVLDQTAVEEIHEESDAVVVRAGGNSWRFGRVILAAGSWSGALLPEQIAAAVHPRRIYLTWYPARHPELFAPERFPVFSRLEDDRTLYGAPSTDGVTVKVTLDGRSEPAAHPDRLIRELTEGEIAESLDTVSEFLPDLIPSIVRSDAYPDLYTEDKAPLLGTLPGRPRTILATGFSGVGFKMAPAAGARAVAIAHGQDTGQHPALLPERFAQVPH